MLKPLHLGTHEEGVHLTAETITDRAADDMVELRGTTGAVAVLSKRGGATLGRWLLEWSRPRQRLQLWGTGDILSNMKISAATLHAWRKRKSFPKPYETSSGPIWEAGWIRGWARDERPRRGRPRKS
jgi:hypothetical protein